MSLNFSAIDFETAVGHNICSVGIVVVENGSIIEEYHQLIQPPYNDYNYYNIRVHGITPDDTWDAPLFSQVFPEIGKRLNGRIVVAHNEGFDRGVLQKSMKDYNIHSSELDTAPKWECTVKIFRKMGFKKNNLKACCDRHNIKLKHHDALSDAKACAKLYLISQGQSV
jgi:DNA polymerase-3 subunit epsilon